MAIYFTSDTHFSHSRIIKHCDRPFSDVHHMNEIILNNLAATITDDDELFHLGDVVFGDDDVVQKIISRIAAVPGRKYLVPGNHDHQHLERLQEAFEVLPPLVERDFVVEGQRKQRIIMCHYPLLPLEASFRSSVNLFGHMHGRVKTNRLQSDMGVDVWHFAPVRIETLLGYMKKLPAYAYPDSGNDDEE